MHNDRGAIIGSTVWVALILAGLVGAHNDIAHSSLNDRIRNLDTVHVNNQHYHDRAEPLDRLSPLPDLPPGPSRVLDTAQGKVRDEIIKEGMTQLLKAMKAMDSPPASNSEICSDSMKALLAPPPAATPTG